MCGIYGVIRKKSHYTLGEKRFKHLVANLGIESAARGTDATGISFANNGHIYIVKQPTPAGSFPFVSSIPNGVNAVIGHTRLSTKGSHLRNVNNHPFYGRMVGGVEFAFAHNGVIWNDDIMRKDFNLPATKIETDSYAVAQLLASNKKLDFKALASVAEESLGSFVYTILDAQDNVYFVKGDNPLYLVDFPEFGFLAYASTEAIFDAALKRDSMLLYYYKCALENKDTKRVKVHYCLEGDIVKYDAKKESLQFEKFAVPTYNYSARGRRYSWQDWDDWEGSCGYAWDETTQQYIFPGDIDAEKKGYSNTYRTGWQFDKTTRTYLPPAPVEEVEDFKAWQRADRHLIDIATSGSYGTVRYYDDTYIEDKELSKDMGNTWYSIDGLDKEKAHVIMTGTFDKEGKYDGKKIYVWLSTDEVLEFSGTGFMKSFIAFCQDYKKLGEIQALTDLFDALRRAYKREARTSITRGTTTAADDTSTALTVLGLDDEFSKINIPF